MCTHLGRTLLVIAFVSIASVFGCIQRAAWRVQLERAESLSRKGQYRLAAQAAEQAERVGAAHFRQHPCDAVEVLQSQASTAFDLGQYRQAAELSRRALSIHERPACGDTNAAAETKARLSVCTALLGDLPEADRLSQEAMSKASNLGARSKQRVLTNRAIVLFFKDEVFSAIKLLEGAVELARKRDSGAELDRLLAETYLGDVYREVGRHEKSEKLLRSAIAFGEELLGSEHPEMIVPLLTLAHCLLDQRNLDETRGIIDRAQAILQQSDTPDHLHSVGIIEMQVYLLFHNGKFSAGVDRLEQALRIAENHFGKKHRRVANVQYNLGSLHYLMGEQPKASEMLEQALTVQQTMLGADHTDTVKTRILLAGVYLAQGLRPMADDLACKATASFRRSKKLVRKSSIDALAFLGRIHYALLNLDEAESVYQMIRSFGRLHDGPERKIETKALLGLAEIAGRQDRTEQRRGYLQQALTIQRKTFGRRHVEVAKILRLIAGTYFYQEEYGSAEKLLREAIDIATTAGGAATEELVEELTCLARIYLSTKRLSDAEQTLQRALSMTDESAQMVSPARESILKLLVRVHSEQGQAKRAQEIERLLNAAPKEKESDNGS